MELKSNLRQDEQNQNSTLQRLDTANPNLSHSVKMYKVVSFTTFGDSGHANVAHSPWWLNEQLAGRESEVL